MAGSIRGITVKIGGDASELGKALKDSEQKSRDLQKELRKVEQDLKFNPGNVELLSQKQKLLTDQIEETRKKLQKLKEAESQVEAQFNAGEIGEEQFRAFRREIISTESKLKSYEAQLESTDQEIENSGKDMDEAATSADDLGDSMDDLDKSTEDTGEGFTTFKGILANLASSAIQAAASALVDLGKQALQVGMDFEKSMSNNEALFGATGAELEKLTETAKHYGSTTQFSATEAADALGYMALAGWDANKASQELGGVLELAAASGMGLAQASDMVTDYLSAFSKSSMTATEFADKLAYAQGHSNTTAEQLGEAYKNCAANLNAAGQDIDTVTALLGAMANQGLKGSEAGTALSAMMRDLTKKMKDGKVQIGDTSVAVQDSQGNYRSLTDILADVAAATDGMGDAERAAALQSTFTSDSIKGLNLILNEGVDSVQGFADELGNCDGAAGQMAATMQDNLSGKLAGLNSAMEGLGITLYEYFSGPLSSVVEIATGFINRISEALAPQQSTLDTFIDGIRESNQQVEASIKHAQDTVTNAESKVAELSAYGDEFGTILDQCDQFNLVTLDNGEKAIVDSAGNIVEKIGEVGTKADGVDDILERFADRGLNTSGISRSSETAQDMIGYVEKKADTVEARLERFAERGFNTTNISQSKSVVVDIYDNMWNIIDTFEEKVGSSGEVEITHDLIDQGTTAIITAFNDTTGSVQSFSAEVSTLQNQPFNLSSLSSQFDSVADSVTTTYHITDEFTKMKIQTMIDSLGDSVSGLAGAWNAQTGELTASKEELENWFDTAKQVAMYDALQSAVNELYGAWGNAAVNVTKANSAMKQALEDFNEEAGTSFETYEEYMDWLNGEGAGAWYNSEEAIDAARDAQIEANEVYEASEEELRKNADTLNDLKDVVGDVVGATDEATGSTEGYSGAAGDAADAVEELTEAQQKSLDAFHDLPHTLEVDMAALQQNLNMSNEEFAKWCDDRVEEAKKIIDAYDDLVKSVKDSLTSYVNNLDATDEEGNQSLNNMLANMEAHRQEVATWGENMMILAQHIGNGFTQEMYDELASQGFEKSKETVALLVEGIDSETGQLSEEAQKIAQMFAENITDEAALAEAVVAYTTAGKNYADAVADGFTGSQEDWNALVKSSMEQGAQAAQGAAEGYSEAGSDAATNAAEGMQEASAQVTEASQAVIDQGKETAMTASQMFQAVGSTIMSALSAGMNKNKNAPVDRLKKIIDSMKTTINGSKTSFQLAGSALTDSFASGVQNHGIQAYNAGRAAVQQAVNGLSSLSAYSAGVNLMQTLISGISSMSGKLNTVLSNAVTNAVNTAVAQAPKEFNANELERSLLGGPEVQNGLAFERSIYGSKQEESPDYTKMLEKIYKGIVENSDKDIVLDTGVLVGSTIDKIDRGLATQYTKKARGM